VRVPLPAPSSTGRVEIPVRHHGWTPDLHRAPWRPRRGVGADRARGAPAWARAAPCPRSPR